MRKTVGFNGRYIQKFSSRPKQFNNHSPVQDKVIKNEKITFQSLRVVFDEDQQKRFGFEDKWKIMSRNEALDFAEDNNLDLLLVNGGIQPAICKLGDAFKAELAQKEKDRERRVKLKAQSLKEMVVGALIDDHDLGHKMDKIISFLNDGHPVKLCVSVKPRELRSKPTCVDETCLKVFDLLEGHVSTLNSSKVGEHRREFLISPKAKSDAQSKGSGTKATAKASTPKVTPTVSAVQPN